jgi:hypothetical protein
VTAINTAHSSAAHRFIFLIVFSPLCRRFDSTILPAYPAFGK